MTSTGNTLRVFLLPLQTVLVHLRYRLTARVNSLPNLIILFHDSSPDFTLSHIHCGSERVRKNNTLDLASLMLTVANNTPLRKRRFCSRLEQSSLRFVASQNFLFSGGTAKG